MTENTPHSGEVQILRDDDGIAVIGDPGLVERFCSSLNLSDRTPVKDLGSRMGAASGMLQAGSDIAENSGRWMKLTSESAAAVKKLPMVTNSTTGNLHATLRAGDGTIAKSLQFVKGPGAGISALATPAGLAAAASMMNQMAMQQTIEEITRYLASIDKKVDDLLRNQTTAVVSKLYGVGDVIDDAVTVRDSVGYVSETSWSKVQNAASIIASSRRYAMQQLSDIADRIEKEQDLGNLAKLLSGVDTEVRDWLIILARCIQLQEESDSLELDRMTHTGSGDIELHRRALQTARQNRRDRVSEVTNSLMNRITAAAEHANTKVLLHPRPSGRVVRSSNQLTTSVIEFQESLGLDDERRHVTARRWGAAVGEVLDPAIEGAASVGNRFSRGVRAFRTAFKEDNAPGDPATRKDAGQEASAPGPAQDEIPLPGPEQPDLRG
ncbi:hypothetical protein [Corynebacterium terpenotabidum]|uniref:Uncharacterized protein n=1 Tax=Corynebacterium terpenotabidum Y-11 TaxID=1200352 RepID=S4XCF7_9CORY|nr:hypothetical protein [Corynebacterium terpenotabidum]AGP30184.1 hypothetical protein A606_02655 [Corynebacterium terpenotabidum Y-11]